MGISSLGHQPEWRSEAKNLCGPSSLSKYQYCLLGKNIWSSLSTSSFPLDKCVFKEISNSRKDGLTCEITEN